MRFVSTSRLLRDAYGSPRGVAAASRKALVRPFVPKFTCRRHAYQCFKTLAQLLKPMTEQLVHEGTANVQVLALRQCLEGVPATIEHEGPLHKRHLQDISEHIRDSTVSELHRRSLKGSLVAPYHWLVRDLWSPSLVKTYTRAVLAHRRECLATEKAGKRPPRFEAGVAARVVFGENQDVAERWQALLGAYCDYLPDRSLLHELENLPQEIAIGEIISTAVESLSLTACEPPIRCVVDVGGGNGILAAQVGEKIGCDSIVVDPRYPGHSIDCCPTPTPDTVERSCPRQKRRFTISRRIAFFKDTQWSTDISVSPHQTALIAKHLCGSAVDECLLHLHRQNALPRILVLVPCCFNKIRLEAYCNPHFLRFVLGVSEQWSLDRILKITDWNKSRYDYTKVDPNCVASPSDGLEFSTATEVPLTRSNFRTVSGSIPSMHALSQYAESIANRGRVEWLEKQGYTVNLSRYVPGCVTPKNKCIVAVRV